MKPEELYGLEVTTGDGEVVTIGSLKDAHATRQASQLETARKGAELDAREAALINRQMLWDQLGADLGKAIPPATRQKIERHLEEQQAVEKERFLTALPELRDEAKFDTFRRDVVTTLQEYGYSVPEMNIRDHRQLLVLRDLMRTKKRLKELLEYTPKQDAPRAAAPQGRGGAPAPVTGRAKTGGEAVSRISALINRR